MPEHHLHAVGLGRPATPRTLPLGTGKLARAVRSTLGPCGRDIMLDKVWGNPDVTKDGVTVDEDVELRPQQNRGDRPTPAPAARLTGRTGRSRTRFAGRPATSTGRWPSPDRPGTAPARRSSRPRASAA